MNVVDMASIMFGGLAPIALGLALLTAIRLLADQRDLHSDLGHTGLSVVAWVLIIAGVLAEMFVFAGPVGAAIGAIVIARAAYRTRQAQQHALVSLLSATAARMMPLIPAVEAYAREHPGTMGARAQYLVELLRQGYSLPDALSECRGAVPSDAIPLIRTGYETGSLAAGLRAAAATRHSGDTIWNQVLTRTVYLTGIILCFSLITIFMMLKITPAMQKIFQDFDAELPAATQALITTSYALADYWYIFYPILIPLVLAIGYSLLRYIGCFPWRVPGTGFVSRRLDTAAVLEALSLVAERQRPMPDALASLARSFPAANVRIRLWRVVRELEEGADWAESLRRHNLIRGPEMAVIGAAQRVGNLPWALRELADSNRRRWGYRALVWIQILFPVVILCIGLLVAFYVVGYFLPLVTLIQNLI